MFKFLELESESFGLDISDLSLKVARLKKQGKFFKLASWGEVEFKEGIIEDGEIKNQKLLIKQVQKISQKLKGEKLDTKNVITSLPEKKAFFEVIKMPYMDLKDLDKSVYFEAENYIPLPIERTYIDFQVISKNKKLNYINVLVAAMPKKIVDSYFFCLKRAGLKVQALEVESQSITRSIIKEGFSQKPVLIVDFGKSITSFIIFSGHSIKFTSSCSVSSQDLTDAIARKLKLGTKEAENLKIKHGLKKIKKATEPALKKIAEEMKKYINYYQSHNKKKIANVILCGRGSNLIGLPEFFSSNLKISAEVANPWINILPEPLNEVPGLSYKESLGYTTALGLSLRGVKK